MYWWVVEAMEGMTGSFSLLSLPHIPYLYKKSLNYRKKLKIIVGLFTGKPWPYILVFYSIVQAADEDQVLITLSYLFIILSTSFA